MFGSGGRIWRTGAGFAAFGVFWGALSVAVPEILADFSLSDGDFGLILSLSLVTSLGSMLWGGRAADRWGAFRLMRLSLALLAAGAVALALAPSLALFVAALVGVGIVTGLVEIGVNAAGIAVDLEAGRPVLGFLHGGFNAGSVLAILALSAVVSAGGGRSPLLLLGAAVIALAVPVLPPQRSGAGTVAPHPGPAVPVSSGAPSAPRGTWGLVRARPRLAVLAVLCGVAFFAEGAVASWGILYLRRDLGAAPVVAGAAVAVFEAAMAAGRSSQSALAHRLSAPRLVTAAGGLLVGATALALATRSVAVTAAGFLLCGLAVAGVVPSLMAITGQVAPDRLGIATAAVTTLGYIGFIGGPPVIGAVAEATSLRAALTLLVPAGLATTALGLVLARPARPHG